MYNWIYWMWWWKTWWLDWFCYFNNKCNQKEEMKKTDGMFLIWVVSVYWLQLKWYCKNTLILNSNTRFPSMHLAVIWANTSDNLTWCCLVNARVKHTKKFHIKQSKFEQSKWQLMGYNHGFIVVLCEITQLQLYLSS